MAQTAEKSALTNPVVAVIAAVVLAVAAGVVLLVRANSDRAPADYQVSVYGNISAAWSEIGSAMSTIDVSHGTATQTIHASSFTLTVESTLPNGASCVVKDTAGKVVAEDGGLPAADTSGLSASSTATCTVGK
ncbi:hypothetical protein ACFORO_32855 [Amycolatopsis halotolerans]|uniref:Uncharacterized protein n=1 Tax=Amycolatopsis halotolerans TaxID=330083 RepID=A0ABV7QTT9_9PSEU